MIQRQRTTMLMLMLSSGLLAACGDSRAVNDDGTCTDSTLRRFDKINRMSQGLQYARNQEESCQVARDLEQESRDFLMRNGNQFWCSTVAQANPGYPTSGYGDPNMPSAVSSQIALQALDMSRSALSACGYGGYSAPGQYPGQYPAQYPGQYPTQYAPYGAMY